MLVMSALSANPALAFQASAAPGFRVKPSDVRLPPGAELGFYRRTIQPFSNWDLICDEDLRRLTKVCNVTQTILGGEGSLAFGWSLTATESGAPMLLLRLPAAVGAGNPVSITLSGDSTETALVSACDVNVCTALLPASDALARAAATGGDAIVSYQLRGAVVRLGAPLSGLTAALAAIE